MKKSLVLAMAMALGVTASAYAANPFSDVPAGHWAYDSISKLAAAGVIEGYGDTTFGGDKLMTRYEMAQIVAKAMAKGANVDKLAAEFAEELDNLGVRVANLEKKADNVKVTGEVRFRYVDQKPFGYYGQYQKGYTSDIRSRIWVNGSVNDDWTYTGMLQNVQDLSDNSGNEKTDFQRAYVQGKLGGLKITAGRYNLYMADGNFYDTRADGVEVSYGSKVKLTGYAGKFADDTNIYAGDTVGGKYWGADLTAEVAKGLELSAGYIKVKDISYAGDNITYPEYDNKVWYVGGKYTVGAVGLSAMYLKGKLEYTVDNYEHDEDWEKDGYVIGLDYKGAKASDPGSWGLWAKYYNQGMNTYLAHTTDANTFWGDGFKGYGVGANYAFAKNIVANVAYYDTTSIYEKKNYDETVRDHRFWTDVTFTF